MAIEWECPTATSLEWTPQHSLASCRMQTVNCSSGLQLGSETTWTQTSSQLTSIAQVKQNESITGIIFECQWMHALACEWGNATAGDLLRTLHTYVLCQLKICQLTKVTFAAKMS